MTHPLPAKLLLVPLARAGGGTGHVRRCLRLARELGERAVLCIEDPRELDRWRADPAWPPGVQVVSAVEDGAPWGLVLLDRRESSAAELTRFMAAGPVVALDEGGEARSLACYTLDVIPGSSLARGARERPANREAPELLDLPERRRPGSASAIRSLLVSFGGEDPARLTESFVAAASGMGLGRGLEITVVEGGAFGREITAPGMRVVRHPPSLAALYEAAELVVTAYGLTAFEALASGTPVLLAHPSAYHERLARRAGLPGIGGGLRPRQLRPRRLRRRLRGLLARPELLREPVRRFQARLDAAGEERGTAGLAGTLGRLAGAVEGWPGVPGSCPCCARPGGPVVHAAIRRTAERTSYRCPRTGLIYAVPFFARQRYEESYFFEEYRAQYGRTYLEDFAGIARAGRARLSLIADLLPPPATVLDVGCAYGPFLAACREAGYRPVGLDVSAEAVEYVRAHLGIRAESVGFLEADLAKLRAARPSCLTMWYVIEHFPRIGDVLRRVGSILPVGGVFAFSTPNGRGVSGRADFDGFLDRSPRDHYSILEPRSAAALLGQFGFRLARVKVTGHHPERSRLLGKLPGLGGRLSELLGLGDTFEAYALKVREIDAKE